MVEYDFQPFSCRFREAILKKKIAISLSRRVRNRIWKLLEEYNYSYGVQRDPNNNWIDNSSVHEEVKTELLKAYGENTLIAYNEREEHSKVDTLQQFVWGCYPAQVFDVIEFIYQFLDPDYQGQLQNGINSILRNENVQWLLCEGYFFQIDSHFLEEYVLCHTSDLLKTHDFQGAFDEFREARNDLESGDQKSAILNACKAFESTLKIITGKKRLQCKDLINELMPSGFYREMPPEIHTDVWKKILLPICLIRDQVSAHGQGKEIMNVPDTLARFALHLTGSAIVFLVEHFLELNPAEEQIEREKNQFIEDDDLPF